MRSIPLSVHSSLIAFLALGMSACSTLLPKMPWEDPASIPAVQVAQASAPLAPGATTTAPPSQRRPFADVIKDATRIDGLLTLWQKDEKLWFELKPSDLDHPFFLSPKRKTGIGEGGFYGGLMSGQAGVVEFRRIGNQIQLIRRNTEFFAPAGTPEGRAVAAAYSPSLLAGTAVVSQAHPERESVLIDAKAIFVSDLLATSMYLQRKYHQGYNFDARNSAIDGVRATPDVVVVEVLSHFATGALATAARGSRGRMPAPATPRTLPDARSMFMTFHYSLAKLPERPMKARKADARVGHFNTGVVDFSDDLVREPRQRYVDRWRLEKKDPLAPLSEPVKPITFWLDKTVPHKYRNAITAGVLDWNKAFEKIGFKNALTVAVQPDDADFDTLDFGRASIRWMTNFGVTFGAIGPRHTDPRSGEILDADIGIESLSSRNVRALRTQILALPGVRYDEQNELELADLASGRVCTFAEHASEQLSYGLDVLEARGELDPTSPEAQQFVEDYLKEVTLHEVGHALGLRHNFRASRAYTERQLADPIFTEANGIAGSVMEYAPINLRGPNESPARRGTLFNTSLGPYDYWAIEYAYKPIAAQDETAELERIAQRSSAPMLAYGSDEDYSLGVDPETLQHDLGDNVVAFARKRIAIAQEILLRQESRTLRPDQDYTVLRRSVIYAVRDVRRAAGMLARQIGGVRTLRDGPGSGRDPLRPVPVAEQRQALALITGSLLSAHSLKISPALQRKLGPDFLARWDAVRAGEEMRSTDFSLTSMVLDLQTQLLDVLMSDAVAVRLLNSTEKSPAGGAGRALTVSELYGGLTRAVWSELRRRGDIAPRRRELQREYVNRLADQLLRPQALSRADARSLLRVQAKALITRIGAKLRRHRMSAGARGHLQDSADTLKQALAAKLLRRGA